ncbi:MAG TPA: hypothetical protein VGJ94_03240 [Syntrophorhabdaceae bacterium]|jgi:hypothetical protein
MKKLIVLIVALVISLFPAAASFSLTALAAEGENEKPVQDKGPRTDALTFTGIVQKVDGALISVKNRKGTTKTFDVSEAKLKGYKDDAEIKTGDVVKVAYQEKDDKLTATIVTKIRARLTKAGAPLLKSI